MMYFMFGCWVGCLVGFLMFALLTANRDRNDRNDE